MNYSYYFYILLEILKTTLVGTLTFFFIIGIGLVWKAITLYNEEE